MAQNAPFPPIPPGRQAEIDLETAIDRIIGHLGEMPRILAAINEDTPQRRTAEKLLILGQSLQEAHGDRPGNDIHAVLTGLGQAARLWLETEDDPNEPPPPAVVLLTGTMTFIARATERAERAASMLGFGAGPKPEPVVPVSRTENDLLLRALATRIDAVRRELRALVTAASDAGQIETEPEVVRGYAAGMTVEIDLADLHLAVGHRKTSLSGLARATLAMAEMTGDFAATIRHWGNRASAGVQAGTSRMLVVVNKAVAGVGTITKAVVRRNLPRATAPGTIHRDGPDYPEMVLIPSGTFMMGVPEAESRREDTGSFDTNARPVHSVEIARPFWLGRYPVTRGEYAAFVADTGYDKDNGSWQGPGFPQTDRHPVVKVSHNDAMAYVAWLSQRTGQIYRLPSEAEGEYAARAKTSTARYWGDRFDNAAAFAHVGGHGTVPVGERRPNAFGLYDMLGNVWEWCADVWHDSYDGAPPEAAAWLGGGSAARLVRGGSWAGHARGVRAACRSSGVPDGRFDFIGFRCARVHSESDQRPAR